jgi:hypothetical protein
MKLEAYSVAVVMSLLLPCLSLVAADKPKTLTVNRETYSNISSVSLTDEGRVSIMYAAGVATFEYRELPNDFLQAWGIAASTANDRRETFTRVETAKAKEAAALQAQANAPRDLKEVSIDQRSFLDKKFKVTGTISLCNYYNYGWYGERDNFYCFCLRSSSGAKAYVYALKERAAGPYPDLRMWSEAQNNAAKKRNYEKQEQKWSSVREAEEIAKWLLTHDEYLVEILVTIPSGRYDPKSSDLLLELTSY